jgi:hypothetical protein
MQIKGKALELQELWANSEQPTQTVLRLYQMFYTCTAKSLDEIQGREGDQKHHICKPLLAKRQVPKEEEEIATAFF